MASNDTVVVILGSTPPTTVFATQDVRLDGSSPVCAYPVLDFDATTAEYMDYFCLLQGYDGGGLTLLFRYAMSSAITGGVRIEAAVHRLADDAEDLDTAHTFDYNGVTDTVPNVSGEVGYASVTFTDGADMDSWADGEYAVIRVRRDPANAGDDASGDLELLAWAGKET